MTTGSLEWKHEKRSYALNHPRCGIQAAESRNGAAVPVGSKSMAEVELKAMERAAEEEMGDDNFSYT